LNHVAILQSFAADNSSTIYKSSVEATKVDDNVDVVLVTYLGVMPRNVCRSGSYYDIEARFTTKSRSIFL
jgi:hypothetical protein